MQLKLNYLFEHKVTVKIRFNNMQPYSLNENSQTHDLFEKISSCTPDIPTLNASIDANEVVINATLEYSALRFSKRTLFTNIT